MPIAPTYPGVYVEEIPSGVRTIMGVSTSVAAFVDYFRRGPVDQAIQVLTRGDFERVFGPLDRNSEASYAINQFFLNGGSEAWVVRVCSGSAAAADVTIQSAVTGGSDSLRLTAGARGILLGKITTVPSPGIWGNDILIGIDLDHEDTGDRFNLRAFETRVIGDTREVIDEEVYGAVSMNPAASDFVLDVVNSRSTRVRVETLGVTAPPEPSGTSSGFLPDTWAVISPPSATQAIELGVTFRSGGVDVASDVTLGLDPLVSLEDAAGRLQSAIRAANPKLPSWARTIVRAVTSPATLGCQLQVIAGPDEPDTIVKFAATVADTATAGLLLLTTATGVTENVAFYRLGSGLTGADAGAVSATNPGDDGGLPDAAALIGNSAATPPTGMHALELVSIFNILCLPRIARVTLENGIPTQAFAEAEVDPVVTAATALCERRRAFFILDPPSNQTSHTMIKAWLSGNATWRNKNVAVYYPRVQVPDPEDRFRPRSFGPSGTMAGLYARTDTERGVWKAPAGTEATLRGVQSLDAKLTDGDNGALNPYGINVLRYFTEYGNVSWGSRTLLGSDSRASEWKYVPVRRFALFLEESLYRGTQWVVFEPNDEPLWAQIRLNVGAFMHSLFRQGAFQGRSPREAYLVKCDAETTTQNDIDKGIVNILVGFAPLKPAEFVILKIQQIARPLET